MSRCRPGGLDCLVIDGLEIGATVNFVEDSVRVIRAGQASSYVVAEEHDDGSLLLRPDTSDPAIVERAPGAGGSGVAERQGLLEEQPNGPTMPVSERQPDYAVAAISEARTAAGPPPSVILEVRDLSVAYGTKKAVDDVSLQIARGEIFGLLGPNGAGKTSTLSAIEGLIKPKSGAVFLDGVDIRRHPTQAKAKMGVQLQATSFQSQLTIKQIMRLYAGLYGIKLSDRDVTDRLGVIGLEGEATKPFKQLSGGQQQRVALYIAVVHEPVLRHCPRTHIRRHSRTG
jgi:ABC-type glutathione transport system ATPase component